MKRLVLDFDNDYDLNRLLESVEIDQASGNRVLSTLRSGNNVSVKATVVKEEYKIANLDKQLADLKNGIEALNRAGFSMNLLERYLRTKGISSRTFHAVMSGIKEFFYEIG